MFTEADLDAYVTKLIDNDSAEMLKLAERGGINGRKAEPSEVVGSVAVSGSSGCVSGKDFLQG